MRGERWLLRIGEYLISRACRFLPGEIRDERCREWTAELPAILRDPEIRLAAHRAARMLGYAAGAVWGTALAAGGARGRLTAVMAVVVGLFTADFLTVVVLNTNSAVNAPGDWVPYCWIVAGIIFLARFGWVLVRQIRRADKPMEGVRDAVLAYGTMNMPDWLLSRLLRAVGAPHDQHRPTIPRLPSKAYAAAEARLCDHASAAWRFAHGFRHLAAASGLRWLIGQLPWR